jgi:hypothetical protein
MTDIQGPRHDLIDRNNAAAQGEAFESVIARLTKRVNALEEQVKRLERRSGRCECMNCIVIGV